MNPCANHSATAKQLDEPCFVCLLREINRLELKLSEQTAVDALDASGVALQNKELLEDIYEWLDGPIAGERAPLFAREVFHEKLGKLLGKEPVRYASE